MPPGQQTKVVFITGGEIVVQGAAREIAALLAPLAGQAGSGSASDWPALVLPDGTDVFVNPGTVAYLSTAQVYGR